MATSVAFVRPPEELELSGGNQAHAWLRWKRTFEIYMLATGSKSKSNDVRIGLLLNAIGDRGVDIYGNFTFTDAEDATKFDCVMAKFDSFMERRDPQLMIREQFWLTLERTSHQSFDNWETTVRRHAKECKFPAAYEEQAIRDKLTFCCKDDASKLKLYDVGSSLTLDKTVEILKLREATRQELAETKMLRTDLQADYVRKTTQQHNNRFDRPSSYSNNSEARMNSFSNNSDARMNRCGNCHHFLDHRHQVCPAKGVQCRSCQRFGHYAVVCRSKSVGEVAHSTQEDRFDFLGNVTSVPENSWCVDLWIGNYLMKFKIDTGADVSIISERVFGNMKVHPTLDPSNLRLKSVGGVIDNMGHFTARTIYRQKSYEFPVYVVRGDTRCLLSRDVSSSMGLVRRVDSVTSDRMNVLKGDPVKIRLVDNSVPYSVYVARRIPLPILPVVKEELMRMQRQGIIDVTEPTDCCSPMVPVIKKNGSVRICVDLKRLNEHVRRERFVIPSREEILGQLSGARVFSSLDAASGFWQILLDEESSKFTTFITPFGRFRFLRLPFGITSAPEIYQRKMSELLIDIEGCLSYIDDIIIFGATQEEHDVRLKRVREVLDSAGLQLNLEKCRFSQPELRFLGQIISADGVRVDDSRVEAIRGMEAATDTKSLKRFLGMVNFLTSQVKDLSSVLTPLHELLKADVHWCWEHQHQVSFDEVKELISTAPIMKFYDPGLPTLVSADASSYGLGGTLLQQHGGVWKPVAFCSRTLSGAERNYAHIEKECLACVWACEKFDRYLCGLPSFTLQTDHKPLVPLMTTRDLNKVPLRCQRYLIRLLRYNPVVEYVPGKDLVAADALSRSPLHTQDVDDELQQDVSVAIECVKTAWPISDPRLEQIRSATESELSVLSDYVINGWPMYRHDVTSPADQYFQHKGHLSMCDGIITYDDRMLIPPSLRREILGKLHGGHLGITKSRDRMASSVWWPKVSVELTTLIQGCTHCQQCRPTQRKEPMLPTTLPAYPWQQIGVDLFSFGNNNFMVVCDYYSRFLEIVMLKGTRSSEVVQQLQKLFSKYGIPTLVVSDNGPQFSSELFQQFSSEYSFRHATTSPHHPQGNGAAERYVQVAKGILKQDKPDLGLLAYLNARHAGTGYTPAELFFGRALRTMLPTTTGSLTPRWPSRDVVEEKDAKYKHAVSRNYNERHGARELPELKPGQSVRIKLDNDKSWTSTGTVLRNISNRSYLVDCENGGTYRRNRRHLMPI